MKKLLSIFAISAVLSTLAFADSFFSQRFFEIKTSVPVDVSNNTIGLTDIFQDELIIDLNEFAAGMPNDGLVITVSANPQVAMNLNLKALNAGGSIFGGVESFGQIGLSKGIFDFICNGNEIGDEINLEGVIRGDAFGYVSANAYFKFRDFDISVTPTFFVPLFHTYSQSTKVTVQNKDDGSISLDLSGDAIVYSFLNIGNDMQALINGGFDIGTSVSYNGLNMLRITGSVRMPIAPGTLNYCSVERFGMHYATNVSSIIGGEMLTENEPFDYKIGEWNDAKYKVNRPFKFNGMVEFRPFGDLATFDAGLGLGVRNPFSGDENEIHAFAEYYLGAGVNVLGIVGATISTEYTNEIFRHQLGTMFNLRLFELDLGVSTQSANFSTSFKLAGFGAYVNVAFGI